MRLDQFVSQSTGVSRAEARQAIRGKQVCVAGVLVTKAAQHIDATESVTLAGEVITLPGMLYLMLHKPTGVVSATQDREHRTVLDLIAHPHKHTLHVVGRLDKDTTGLILLTNDGEWSHRLMSPKHHVPKTYLAMLAAPLSEQAAEQLRGGVQLNGEQLPTQPAEVEVVSAQQARITIHEGKYHQVKRMFAAVGNRVLALHRERVGDWVLPDDLRVGDSRTITIDE